MNKQKLEKLKELSINGTTQSIRNEARELELYFLSILNNEKEPTLDEKIKLKTIIRMDRIKNG
jgi:hypothetical protein